MERIVPGVAGSVGVVATVQAAVGLLTRLPVGSVADVPGAAAFAVVGAAVGGLGAVALVLLALAGEPVLGAIAAVAVLAAVSGGLHLDGLADTADALVAPDAYAAERAREDPAVGPGGVVVLLLVLGAEVAALASVTASWGTVVAASVVVVGGAVSRWHPCSRSSSSGTGSGTTAWVPGSVTPHRPVTRSSGRSRSRSWSPSGRAWADGRWASAP